MSMCFVCLYRLCTTVWARVHVFVYMCTNVHVWARVHVFVYMCTNVHVWTRVHVFVYMCTNVHVWHQRTWARSCVCIYVHQRTCMDTRSCVCIYVHQRTCMGTHSCVCMYVHQRTCMGTRSCVLRCMDGMLYTVSGGIQWMGCCTQLMGAFN